MRKITWQPIIVFAGLSLAIFLLATITAAVFPGKLPLEDFRGVVLVFAWIIYVYGYAIVAYRLFLAAMPLPEGEITANSRAEFTYHVYVLFYLIFFYSIIRSGFFPAPFMRLFYLAVGTRLGNNTYSQGIIHDPPFVKIGHDTVVGQGALIIPHVIEGTRLAHYSIHIGNNVTIGASAILLAGTVIDDGAIVSAGAVVTKGTHIGPGEVWGGIPAKELQRGRKNAK